LEVIQRIHQLNKERNWTDYKLAKEAGISQSTISNITYRGNSPTLFTLEKICHAYGITVSQFFSSGENPLDVNCDSGRDMGLDGELHQLGDLYKRLSLYQRESVFQYMNDMLAGTAMKTGIKPEIKPEMKPDMKTEIKAEIKTGS